MTESGIGFSLCLRGHHRLKSMPQDLPLSCGCLLQNHFLEFVDGDNAIRILRLDDHLAGIAWLKANARLKPSNPTSYERS